MFRSPIATADGEDQRYFVRRMHASVALAEAAADSLAKLVHFELAGRYSVAALAARRMTSGIPGRGLSENGD